MENAYTPNPKRQFERSHQDGALGQCWCIFHTKPHRRISHTCHALTSRNTHICRIFGICRQFGTNHRHKHLRYHCTKLLYSVLHWTLCWANSHRLKQIHHSIYYCHHISFRIIHFHSVMDKSAKQNQQSAYKKYRCGLSATKSDTFITDSVYRCPSLWHFQPTEFLHVSFLSRQFLFRNGIDCHSYIFPFRNLYAFNQRFRNGSQKHICNIHNLLFFKQLNRYHTGQFTNMGHQLLFAYAVRFFIC